MRPISTLLFLSALTVAGCSTGPGASTPADHPANPDSAPMPLHQGMSTSGMTGGMDGNVAGMHDTMPTTQASVTYSCPMHPDVVSDKPGSCPKCGMTLVKKGS